MTQSAITRDTPAAISAMEIAHAYIEELRAQERPGYDETELRKEQLNTLALASKQLARAERCDPDAILQVDDGDGNTCGITLNQLKAEAYHFEGLTHHIYNARRAIPALVAATQLSPDDPRHFAALGLTHLAHKNKSRAVEALRRAVALDPKNIDYRKALDRAENLSLSEILSFKATRAGEHVFDSGVTTANGGIRVYNTGVIIWNICVIALRVVLFPLRVMLYPFRILNGSGR